MIPLSEPNIGDDEKRMVKATLDDNWVSTAGRAPMKLENKMIRVSGSQHAVSTSSGTAALHMALVGLGVGAGDKVLIPDFTFVATANAVSLCGAEPVLIDVDPATMAMDVELARQCLTNSGQNVKAIIVVHPYGYLPDMQPYVDISQEFGVALIEDAAAALGSWRDGKHAGTWGTAGCFSFNGNKILTTGAGGMIISHDAKMINGLRVMRDQAKMTMRPEIDVVAFNYGLSSLNAALGLAQFERLDEFVAAKNRIFNYYKQTLTADSPFPLVNLPSWSPDSNKWMSLIECQDPAALYRLLLDRDILTERGWKPIHEIGPYRSLDQSFINGVSKSFHDKLLVIPSSTTLKEEQQKVVVDTLLAMTVESGR